MSAIPPSIRRQVKRAAGPHARALVDRPWLAPGYDFAGREVQDPDLGRVRAERPYRGPVRIQIPGDRRSTMVYDGDDIVAGIAFYLGPFAYETTSTMLFAVLARHARHVLDVGCHTGIFSLVAAAADDDVFVDAFEVVPPIAARARQNVEHSGWSQRVRVHTLGLSDRVGSLEVHYNERRPLVTGASFEESADRDRKVGSTSVDVRTTTLDEWWHRFRRPQLDLVKIDVERHEVPVFAGGAEMLHTCRPTIVAEVLSVADLTAMRDTLRPLGYSSVEVVDEDAGVVRSLDDGLRHDDGTPYTSSGHRNVVFGAEALPGSVTTELRRRRELGTSPKSVDGSGAAMAASERRWARRYLAEQRLGVARRTIGSHPVVQRVERVGTDAVRRSGRYASSIARRPFGQ